MISMHRKSQLVLILQGVAMLSIAAFPFFENGHIDLGWDNKPFQKTIGVGLEFVGFILIVAAVKIMGRHFEYKTTPKDKLIKDWPFNMVRNPIYFAAVPLGIGWSLTQSSYGAAITTIILMAILRWKISIEEHYLKIKFGQEYLEYLSNVPRLIPRCFKNKSL